MLLRTFGVQVVPAMRCPGPSINLNPPILALHRSFAWVAVKELSLSYHNRDI